MSERRLRMGVLGAGVFASHHARKIAEHHRADLAGIHDRNADRAKALAERFGAGAHGSAKALIDDVDAVVVATPATHHGEAVMAALFAGCHVLVEKPMAHTVAQAAAMIAEADRHGLVLQVGHQERFVMRAIGLDRVPDTPVRIEAVRETVGSQRCQDVGAALDLMTHDLDLAIWLMGEVKGICGESRHDYARADVILAAGQAVLIASREAVDPVRTLKLSYPSGTVEIDFMAKTVLDGAGLGLEADYAAHPLAADSLGAGTDAFIASVLDGAPVLVDGAAGLAAVEAALAIGGDSS